MSRPALVFTGGHHTSALSVAQAMAQEGYTIYWLGHRHSQWGDKSDSAEFREVTSAGIQFFPLVAGKFYRTFNPVKLLRLPLGFIRAFLLLIHLKYRTGSRLLGIVSFGGYLAVPVVISGWILGLPTVTHEQTVVAGYANRIVAKFARKIALTWPSSRSHYPQDKTVLTGLPLRPEVAHLKAGSAVTAKNPRILILGGKQGSHIINETVFAALPELTKLYSLIHQTGSSTRFRDFDTARTLVSSRYSPHEYLFPEQLADSLEWADVVVSRSGAHTTYELGYLGKRSVLIPIPWVSHNEQMHNARVLVSAGLSVIVSQELLTPKSLLAGISAALKLSPRPLPLPRDGLSQMVQLIKQEFHA